MIWLSSTQQKIFFRDLLLTNKVTDRFFHYTVLINFEQQVLFVFLNDEIKFIAKTLQNKFWSNFLTFPIFLIFYW